MCMKVLPIGEARRRLPELVRKVAGGHPPVAIGRRGRIEAMLAAPDVALAGVRRRPLRGLLEVVGSQEDLDKAQREIRGEIEASLERTAALIGGPSRKSVRRSRKGR
jgi:hypothetical protein